MTELRGRIKDITKSLDGGWNLTLAVKGDPSRIFGQLRDKDLTVNIKEFRNKRSLNANALCWKLCTEIADVLRTDKDSIYLVMLRRYGQSEIVSLKSHINPRGYFKYFDRAGESVLNMQSFTHYRVYKGSSEYDTREMSILLDGIISEAENIGIPVMTERELSLIKEEWYG